MKTTAWTEEPESDVSSLLGRNVRQLREARALTQAQAAKLAEIPRGTWANMESGAANPTLAVLHRVAGGLHGFIEENLTPPRPGGAVPVLSEGVAPLEGAQRKRDRAAPPSRRHSRHGDRPHGLPRRGHAH